MFRYYKFYSPIPADDLASPTDWKGKLRRSMPKIQIRNDRDPVQPRLAPDHADQFLRAYIRLFLKPADQHPAHFCESRLVDQRLQVPVKG